MIPRRMTLRRMTPRRSKNEGSLETQCIGKSNEIPGIELSWQTRLFFLFLFFFLFFAHFPLDSHSFVVLVFATTPPHNQTCILTVRQDINIKTNTLMGCDDGIFLFHFFFYEQQVGVASPISITDVHPVLCKPAHITLSLGTCAPDI